MDPDNGRSADPVRRVRLADLLGIFLLVAVVAFGGQRLFGDSDPALHVATGRFIVEQREIPRTDPFSATVFGTPWFAHEWLADVGWFLVFRAAGWQGLVALAALLIACAHVVLYRGLVRRGDEPLVAFGVVALAAAAASVHWLARPHLLTLLFLVVWSSILEDVTRGRAPVRRLFVLPALMLAWVNVHGGFLIGFVVLGAYFAATALAGLRRSATKSTDEAHGRGAADDLDDGARRARALLAPLGFAGLAAAAATLVNPYGAALPVHLLRYFAAPRSGLARNAEFAPADPSDRAGQTVLGLVVAGAVVLLFHVLARRRVGGRSLAAPSLGAVLAFVATAVLAFVSVRHVALLAVFAAMLVADGLSAVWTSRVTESNRAGAASARAGPRRGEGWIFAAGCVVIALAALAGLPTRAGYDPSKFPVDLVRELRAAREVPPGPVFAPDLWGGYLVLEWPEAKVFVDGRSDMYGDAFLDRYAQAYEGLPGWRSILAESGVTLAVLPRSAPLAAVVSDDPQWQMVASDSAAFAFRKR